LIIVNFSKTQQFNTHVKIPPEALSHIGMSASSIVKFRVLLGGEYEGIIEPSRLYKEGDRYSGIPLTLNPKSVKILELS
jgi:hypothetical protein